MNGFTFAPSLGWIAGSAIAALMVAFALGVVVLHARRRREGTDETPAACVRRCVMCLLVALMALTPSVVTTTTSRAVNATDVVIATDVTGSMGVADAVYGEHVDVSRLDAARAAIGDITSRYAGSSFAAVSFGAGATQDVPLTPDARAIDNWASTLRVEPTSASSGSSLDAALDTLLLTLKAIRDAHPDDTIVLYVITDGEQTTQRARRTFSSLRRYLDDACVIGVGSTAGGRIPQTDDDGAAKDGSWVLDPSTGRPGVSIMDEGQIRSLADELSGTALIASGSGTVLEQGIARESSAWRQSVMEKKRTRVTPWTWPFAIALFVTACWEFAAWFIQSRRLLQ